LVERRRRMERVRLGRRSSGMCFFLVMKSRSCGERNREEQVLTVGRLAHNNNNNFAVADGHPPWPSGSGCRR
jgi:hypothetical protein